MDACQSNQPAALLPDALAQLHLPSLKEPQSPPTAAQTAPPAVTAAGTATAECATGGPASPHVTRRVCKGVCKPETPQRKCATSMNANLKNRADPKICKIRK